MKHGEIILSKSEYESLLGEVHRLQAKISELTALRDDLIYHVCPALQAEYEEKIASLEREILAAEMYLRENQRTLEILQAQMNQQKEPDVDEAQRQAKEEFHEYEEDLKRKAKEAEDFRDKWENESQWSEHDRREKEEKKKREEQKQREQSDTAGLGKGKDADSIDADAMGGSKESKGPYQIGADDENASGEGRNSDQADDSGDYEDETGNKKGLGGSEQDSDAEDEPADDSPIKKLKRLYRKIVKRLHPDVHPNPTLREKELLNMAQEAMKRGDLQAMERIYDELCGMDAPEEKFEDTPEGIAKLKELIRKLKERVKALQKEILNIRSSFPYTMKSFLEDEEAVMERRHELQEKLRNLREADEKLVEFIRKIREEMGL